MSLNDLPNSIYNWLKEHKKAALLLGTIPVTVPLLYFLNVWLVGSIAAAIYDFITTLPATPIIKAFFEPEQQTAAAAHVNTLTFIFNNPSTIAWAWLTRPDELQHPGIMQIWLYLNMVFGLITAATAGYLFWRRPWQKNTAHRVHGLKVVDNPAYGTSRWGSIKDLKQFCEFGPPVPLEKTEKARFPGGNLIGELDGKIIRVNFTKIPKDTPKTAPHVIVYGGTGSGKTFSFVSSNIITAVSDSQSILMIDPKGELFQTFSQWLKQNGYTVRVLNFMSPEHSHRWNPVAECQTDAEISEMVDTLSRNVAGPNPSYFELKAMELMEALIGLLKADFPAEQQHMRALMTLVSWPEEALNTRFKKAYESNKISSTIYERWQGVIKKNPEYAISNLTAMLKNLTTEALASMMSEQEIQLEAIGKQKTALFLVIPTGGEGEYLKPILSMFYKFLFKRLDKLAFTSPGQTLPVQVRNIWDEMANVGLIPGLPEIISTARSKGIQIQMILQTPIQLESVYGIPEAKAIIGNCPTVMLIGIAPADQELAEMFSKKLGNAAVEIKRVSEDISTPQHWLEPKKKIRTVTERPLMTIDEILRINPKDGIALLQWSYPVYLKKVGWVDLPQAKDIKTAGKQPVEKEIPIRGYDIELPKLTRKKEDRKKEEQKDLQEIFRQGTSR